MLVSEKFTCISAYSSRGFSRPRIGSYTGSESYFTSLSSRNSISFVKDKIRFSGSTCCFSVALVTKKHKFFPGICDAAGGKNARLLFLVFASKGHLSFSISSPKIRCQRCLKTHVRCDCYRTRPICKYKIATCQYYAT